MKVIIKPRAQKSISKIAFYISQKGYPETAVKFVGLLEEFIYTLADYPDKYPVSRHKAFAKQNFRQVPFKKNYIILYKVVNNELVVFNVVHAKRLR